MSNDQRYGIVPVYSSGTLIGHVRDALMTATCLSGAFEAAYDDERLRRIVECAAEVDRDDADYYLACSNWRAACEEVGDVFVLLGGLKRNAESFALDPSWNAEIGLDVFGEVVDELLSE